MRDFEYVKMLTKTEIASFVNGLVEKQKKDNNTTLLKEKSKQLKKEYILYEAEKINNYKEELEKLELEKGRWETKTCLCGKRLRFINGFEFWGCPDYKNQSKKHTTFNKNQEEIFKDRLKGIKVRIPSNWCSDIIKRLDLKGEIKAKQTIEFFLSEGFEDLRKKYGYKNTFKSISGFITANKESKKEEAQIRDFLKGFFSKVSYQIYIRYKIKGDQERFCILDLIASDAEKVYLIEVKRHNMYIEEDQLSLYYDLLLFLMQQGNDSRKLKALFIVAEYFESTYNVIDCVLFDDLLGIKSKSNLEMKFDDKIYLS